MSTHGNSQEAQDPLPLRVEAGDSATAAHLHDDSGPRISSTSVLLAPQLAVGRVPEAVRAAINAFTPPPGYSMVKKRKEETSLIYAWGVRVARTVDPSRAYWICLASEHCRLNTNLIALSKGKTSKATHHLKTMHGRHSDRTEAEQARKRERGDIVAQLRNSELFRVDPARLYVLLEIVRIVNNHLSFRFGEYEESLLITELAVKDNMKTTLNAKGTKYLGLRIFFVDPQFNFKSVLLGIRHFRPRFGDREGGIRSPFRRWIGQILRDFEITEKDLFAATSDAGPDVKWMMRHGLHLPWEWCLPHMVNAATKAACGMVANAARSENRALTNLIRRIVTTVYQTKSVEVVGDLFRELCDALYSDRPRQLVGYAPHRFMTLTRVIERILSRWDAISIWYSARRDHAARHGRATPATFPLQHDRVDLQNLLSLLKPVSNVSVRSQAATASQLEVFATLLSLRRGTLNVAARFKDYRSTPTDPLYLSHDELSATVAFTRQLLRDKFDRNFFHRYKDAVSIRECSFIPEMQMLLHPRFKKSLDTGFKDVVVLCNTDAGNTREISIRNFELVKDTVKKRLLAVMESIHGTEAPEEPRSAPMRAMYSADIEDLIHSADDMGDHEDDPMEQVLEELRSTVRASQCAEELATWLTDNVPVAVGTNCRPESVLAFWRRQSEEGVYPRLCQTARVLFAVPASAAQIERDFGIAGMTVTAQRSSIAPYNVDMCSFLNCNRDFIDLAQCARIHPDYEIDHLPSNVLVDLEEDQAPDIDYFISTYFADMEV